MQCKSLYYVWSFVLLIFVITGCSGGEDSGLIDGDKDNTNITDGDEEDSETDSESTEQDMEDESEQETEAENDEPLNLFDEVWWPQPDETPITSLLLTSEFFKQHDWLIKNMSSWFEENTYEEPGEIAENSSELGYYGVGNGLVFGFVGSNYPRSRLHSMLGPGYQKHNDGYFSDFFTVPAISGERLKWSHDLIWTMSDTRIVMTSTGFDESPLEMDTVTFSPNYNNGEAQDKTIIQVINIRNTGEEDINNFSLHTQSHYNASTKNAENAYFEQHKDYHIMRVRAIDYDNWQMIEEAGEKDYPALQMNEITIKKGEEKQFVMVYEFALETETIGKGFNAVTEIGWEILLTQCNQWWQNWSASGMKITTPDQRVNDIIQNLLTSIRLSVTDLGGVVPISFYTNTWIRDSYAPVRTFLKFGHTDDAWGIMDYYYKGACIEGGIGNAIQADNDITQQYTEPDWYSKIPFNGRLKGEGPSHIPLMHAAYWQYTGEKGDLIAERWNYLMHTLMGQGITEEENHEGLMYFSGDETFRPQLSSNLMLPGGANYKFEDLCYSANSAFLFVRAAESLSKYAGEYGLETDDINWLNEKADFIRSKTEDHYWLDEEKRYSPFIFMDGYVPETRPAEDVNTIPVWLSYLDTDSEKAKNNITSTFEAIGQDNAILQNIPTEPANILGFDVGSGLMTGMSPAYFLYNVAEMNLETGDRTLDTVGTYVSKSGNIHEVATFSQPGIAFCPFYEFKGFLGESYGRYREWEGAILAESFMHYLVGLEMDVNNGWLKLSPRLAHDSNWLKAENIIFKGHSLSLNYEKDGFDYSFSLTSEDDPATFGLDEYRLKLITANIEIESIKLNDTELSESDYEILTHFDSLKEIRITTSPIQGELKIEIAGKHSSSE